MKEFSFRSYGFAYKSDGSAVVTGSGVKWLHVYCYPVSRAVNLYTKLNAINQFSNLRKPKFETINMARKGSEYFVYTISDFYNEEIPSTNIANPLLLESQTVSHIFISTIAKEVEKIWSLPTTHQSMRENLIFRRLMEAGIAESQACINTWGTIHGDMHWGNFLKKNAIILDWESWGNGPQYCDIASWYVSSLRFPNVMEAILGCFDLGIVSSKDFHKCVVLECIERLKVSEREASYKPYITDLSSLLNFHKGKII